MFLVCYLSLTVFVVFVPICVGSVLVIFPLVLFAGVLLSQFVVQ